MTATDTLVAEIAGWLRQAAPEGQLTCDSRTVAPGDVFFAYPGEAADGRKYIAQAIERGAAAVLYEDGSFAWEPTWRAAHRAVDGLKKKAGAVANAFYGKPDAQMFTAAVTGTNGKTSCTQWIANALSRFGEPAVVIGTLGVGMYRDGEAETFEDTGNTTPDAVTLQRSLAKARAAGAAGLAIEASSIGLHQGRMHGMHIDAALFTNLTRDHLDYHGDMAAYEAAKTMLFDWPGLKHAVINLDDEMGQRLVARMRQAHGAAAVVGYTLRGNAPDGIAVLAATDVRTSHAGTVFNLASPFGSCQVRTQMVGQFNVSNVLGVLGVLLAKGIEWTEAVDAIEALLPVPGRMQQLGGQDAPLVVIDYAHTPDALEKTLASLRHVAKERGGDLWCVFGCGGDRDPGKRPQMGRIAMAADHVVVTSDNPRGEEPGQIIKQVVSGMDVGKASTLQEIEDRAAAILWAIKHAQRNDVVLLAGKGHETYQEIKGKRLPFLDADHAALALAARVTMKGTS
ncbi:MAG TPA: UDP-N-acetylmuramoyl-L-alanyl-D-glutamate--2,6-diaminopimelate ligase [Paucimonas sp.]|nr:UDP-N-acetylmuramoyl-L-alanyl-D-glutamate--2,6-diaminopimelate ligase [Paucimonas sp.]